MLILLGIFCIVFVSAIIEAYTNEQKEQAQAQQWIQHNRMMAHARENAKNGVGTWHH
jgi:hypothetical protein